MQRKAHYRPNVKAPFNAAEAKENVARMATDDLWRMLDVNLERLISAWEGYESLAGQEHRLRLAKAIAGEIRSRGVQLRLQF